MGKQRNPLQTIAEGKYRPINNQARHGLSRKETEEADPDEDRERLKAFNMQEKRRLDAARLAARRRLLQRTVRSRSAQRGGEPTGESVGRWPASSVRKPPPTMGTPQVPAAERPAPSPKASAIEPTRIQPKSRSSSAARMVPKCPLCSGTISDFDQHVRATHGYERYACPKCGSTALTTPADWVKCLDCGRRYQAISSRMASSPSRARK